MEEKLRELYKKYFVLNCEIDDYNISVRERESLDKFDGSELLKNLETLLSNLIKFKQSHIKSEITELNYQSEQLEKLLQKAEDEIRTHIRKEHQLKLIIDNSEGKISETPEIDICDDNNTTSIIKKLRISNKELANEVEKLKGNNSLMQKENEQLKQETQQLKHENSYHVSKVFDLKTTIYEQNIEIESLKNEITEIQMRNANSTGFLRGRSSAMGREKQNNKFLVRKNRSPYLIKDNIPYLKEKQKILEKSTNRHKYRKVLT